MNIRRLIALSVVLLLLLSGCQLIGGGQEGGDPEVGGGVGEPTDGENGESGGGEETVIPDDGDGEEAGSGEGEEEVQPDSPPVESLPRVMLEQAQTISAAPVSPFTPGTTVVHQVQQGEWLHQIARCYGASYTAVLQQNPLPNPNIIQPARQITVPNVGSEGPISGPPCVQPYTVQVGETFDSLAQQFGTEAALLQRANPGVLSAGRVIFVPDNSGEFVMAEPPTLSQSILFNWDGAIAVWQAGGDLEYIPDTDRFLLDLVTNRDGNFVLTKMRNLNGDFNEVVLVDRSANSAVVLESNLEAEISLPGQESMIISDDGQNGAYLVRDGDSFSLTTFPTGGPDDKLTIGIGHDISEQRVPQLFIGSDNGRFLLLDETGIYEYSYQLDGEPRQILAIDPTNFDQPLIYFAQAWSPTGQYLLLDGGFFEGLGKFVMDSETGAIVEVPRTTTYVIGNDGGWLPDGRLVAIRLSEGDNAVPETAVFQPEQDGDGNFALTELSSTTLALPPELSDSGSFVYVAELPDVLPTNEQLVMLFGLELGNPGLYQSANLSAPLTSVVEFEGFFTSATWSDDGRAVMMDTFQQNGGAGDVLLLSLDSDTPFSMIDWLGFQIADFHWINGN